MQGEIAAFTLLIVRFLGWVGGSGGTIKKKREPGWIISKVLSITPSSLRALTSLPPHHHPPPDVSTLHILFSPLFFLSSISHPEEGLIEFVHVEKQYKTGKYFMAAILYTCQIE